MATEPVAGLRLRLRGIALANVATLAWATNAVLGRWLKDDVGPLTLTALRFTVATSALALILRRAPHAERRPGADRWWLLGMSLMGVLGFSPLLYLGLRYSTAANSSLIQGFSPLITALIAGFIIGEPASARQKLGALAGLIGVAGLVCRGSLTSLMGLAFNPGDLMFVAGAVAWALYSVFARRVMRSRSALSATFLSNLMALPVLLVVAAVEWQHVPINLRPATIAAIAHICLVPTLVGYWSWNRSVQDLGAGGAMVLYNTLPLYGVIMGAALLGEPLGWPHLVFGGLIVAGGLWGSWGKQ